jgi:catechol 2,3-dioxygenase-like lactoylglutathione lyase family enzyme
VRRFRTPEVILFSDYVGRAVEFYAEHLGFEPVDAYDFWATGFEGSRSTA